MEKMMYSRRWCVPPLLPARDAPKELPPPMPSYL